MTKSIFITGTDTNVGKTFIGTAIAENLTKEGKRVGILKPCESGCQYNEGKLIPQDTLKLINAAGNIQDTDLACPYQYLLPLAPTVACEKEGDPVKFEVIRNCFKKISREYDFTLIEGAGGLLCPLSEKKTVSDLIKFLDVPVIIVSSNKLGTINHTLLTIEHCLRNNITIHSVILNNLEYLHQRIDESLNSNLTEIQKFHPTLKIFETNFSPSGNLSTFLTDIEL